MGSSLFLLDLLTGHEPALAPERELSQLAALRQATRVGRFSAGANIRAAVWDKPRSDYTVGVCRFMGRETRSPLGKQTCNGKGESRLRVTRRPQPAFLPEGEG